MRLSPQPASGPTDSGPRRSWSVRGLVALLALLAAGPGIARSQETSNEAPDVLQSLRPGHPRLYVIDEDLARIRDGRNNPTLDRWFRQVREQAEEMLDDPPVEHRLEGPRLLAQSRRALDRIATLAAMYRLDGDPAKRDRAVKEMLTAAAFPDWNPSHFLDTAEMTNALAIGYDWLHRELSEVDRTTIRTAIVELGLKPGLKVYESGRGWPNSVHNWNQVCNGGLTAGALAIADEEPEIARRIIDHGRASIGKAMASFAPDGGWAEGPGYWNYATRYNVFYLDAIRSALGTDFGLEAMPGFPVTGEFRMHAVGPIGRTFNFADAGDRAGTAPQMLWLARVFNRPDFTLNEIAQVGDRPDVWHLLYARGTLPETAPDPPTGRVFRGVDVAFLRSDWSDPEATYVGFKGGDNRANHSHLDLGTFVLDALGARWVIELGTDDYNLPGYFGGRRWTYYRLGSRGQNTLMIDGENQDPSAKAPLTAFRSSGDEAYAVADLTAGFGSKVESVRRGIRRIGRDVLVQDELTPRGSIAVAWNAHVPAGVEVRGDRAILNQRGKTLVARILSPPGAAFTVESASGPPPERQAPDVRRLTIHLPEVAEPVTIAVLFEPGGSAEDERDLPLEPLDSWVRQGALPPVPVGD